MPEKIIIKLDDIKMASRAGSDIVLRRMIPEINQRLALLEKQHVEKVDKLMRGVVVVLQENPACRDLTVEVTIPDVPTTASFE